MKHRDGSCISFNFAYETWGRFFGKRLPWKEHFSNNRHSVEDYIYFSRFNSKAQNHLSEITRLFNIVSNVLMKNK